MIDYKEEKSIVKNKKIKIKPRTEPTTKPQKSHRKRSEKKPLSCLDQHAICKMRGMPRCFG